MMSLSHASVLCPLLALTAASRSASAGALSLSLHPHALAGKALIVTRECVQRPTVGRHAIADFSFGRSGSG